jgi:hypothetical protein
MPLSRRSVMSGFLAGSAFTFLKGLPIRAKAASPLIRKNIDSLSVRELRAYITALQKLRTKSTVDPAVKFSYAHLAGLHNLPSLFDGACEHWNYKFFPWHRALLINYEDALRAIDPSVTIPYWNWTEKPSGKRFPVAFENDPLGVQRHYGESVEESMLHVLFNENRLPDESLPPYNWAFIKEIITKSSVKHEFLGTENNHGPLENPPHDDMHGFIGGDLVETSTAADDPIFWSFHTFIDLLWWFRHKTINDSHPREELSLNGMRSTTAMRSDGPTLVKHAMRDATVEYGYDYEFAPPPEPLGEPVVAVRSFSDKLPVLAELARQPAEIVRSFDIEPVTAKSSRLRVRLEGVSPTKTFPYTAFVYVYPRSQDFRPSDPDFQRQFLVGHFAQWINSHTHHEKPREFTIELERETYTALRNDVPLKLTATFHVRIGSATKGTFGTRNDGEKRLKDQDAAISRVVIEAYEE